MQDLLTGLEDAVAALRQVWTGGDQVAAGPASELNHPQLAWVLDRLGAVTRQVDGVRAQVAAEVDRESRRELGADSLAKEQGYRNAAAMIAAVTGIGAGEAHRVVAVGRAIAPRQALTGEPLPAKHPFVAEGVHSGSIGQLPAGMIVTMLDRVAVRSKPDDRERVEQVLVARAPGLTLDQLRKVVAHAEAWLDQDGVEPTERERRDAEYLHLVERDGFLVIDGKLEISRGAAVKVAIDALVSAVFRSKRDDVTEGDDDVVRPSVPKLQAEALIQLAEHALGCTKKDLPLAGATVVVRMDLETLTDGAGLAEIDGIAAPISAAGARHFAAAAGIIPVVLDGESEVMDWGREKRLFTRAQQLALAERDGGCAMCNLPPSMTKAHHLNWWARDHGETDIDEGVLLCEPCHHHVHDNGWEIRIEGHGVKARVWFIPPVTVDPAQTPRLGGRARFCYRAA